MHQNAEAHGISAPTWEQPSLNHTWRRRSILSAAGVALASSHSWAQDTADFPSKPLRIVVGFAAGGLADITVRVVGEALSKRLGQQVVIDNRPGGAGTPAAMAASSAPPDGYTLTILSTGNAINKTLFRTLPYDPITDFRPVSCLAIFDLLLLVSANSRFRSIADVLAAKRDGLAIGTISPGSTQNLSGEWLRVAAGMDATVVPYRSTADVLTAVQRDDVQIGFESYAASRSLLEGGQLRAIGSTGARRSALLPDVPTLHESGLPDYAVVGWNALFAPARTPRPAIELLNRHITEILNSQEVKARLLGLGIEPAPSSPDQMGARLKEDVATWASVIEKAKVQRQ
ncbi:Bug family tripartite tricarboxylate transporter substrate binding protein [Pararoseomonas indoligenes]|uniref:Tripartite tricarboxylate transporter substrate binding protein n=1 Tax=Roseomonas indoligenes TaxID=2820811 RepID=A0A940N3C5_9PROT|nr:tripartite tricarboxylate transporter substrate-binding protein [Pararoseomonas indoligenes]MBP0496478.1 tripartite tricarboxylate transporter substrate binding protein [Pararoseomonas indoligenes]